MTTIQASALVVLQLCLHDEVVGHLARRADGASALIFDPAWANSPLRKALTLCSTPKHPAHTALFARPWLRTEGLHPLLANLLPEAGLRTVLMQQLALSEDDDFHLLAALGTALPGAWKIRALAPQEIPAGVLDFNARVNGIHSTPALPASLRVFAGSQPKLVPANTHHLLKLPTRPGQTRNEYSALQLARIAGIDCVEAELIAADETSAAALPPSVNDEPLLMVRRFDRTAAGKALHTEDFAQALFKAPLEKYSACDAVLLGRMLYRFTPQGLRNVQEFARRLLMNVLLGNGDAHLKNWSFVYADGYQASLAPAYDLAFTQPLNITEQAMTIGDCSDWYALEFSHFEQWSRAVGVQWRVIKPVLLDTVERARTLWPQALEALPMAETDKLLLRHHWKSLTKKLQYGL